mmetsp:Transcript_35822/g.65026  ORF Transcript_35822/g.65026 Transcript_35822/m.65026 type:complete len:274 (+) Transcript_35822:50-871(+)
MMTQETVLVVRGMNGETLLSTAFETVAHLKVGQLEQLMPLPCGPGECASFVSEGKLLDDDCPLEQLPHGESMEILRLLQEGLTFHVMTDMRVRVSWKPPQKLKGTLKMRKSLADSLTVEKLKQKVCDLFMDMDFKVEAEALSHHFDLYFGDTHLPNDAIVENVLPLVSPELKLHLGPQPPMGPQQPQGIVVVMIPPPAQHDPHPVDQNWLDLFGWAIPQVQPAAPAWPLPPMQPAAPAQDMPPTQLATQVDMTQTELREALQERLHRSLQHRG